MKSVFVVIVNYRTAALVVQCLASLLSEVASLRGGRVIVVDNASGDASVEHIKAAIDTAGWGAWAEVIALPRNGGFAYGNNRAIECVRQRSPEFGAIVCLNPDTTVRAGALAAMLSYLEGHPGAGIVGASIEDEHGVRQRTAHVFPSPLSELESGAQLGVLSRLLGPRSAAWPPSDVPHTCDWVSGACFAVRKEVFDTIGLLDEGYFLYFEETDFCLRSKQAGWACWYVSGARVVHAEGSSTGIRDPKRRRPAYWFASRRRFFAKAHGLVGLVVADMLWAVGRSSFLLRRAIGLGGAHSHVREPERFAMDLLIGDAKAILSGRLRKPGMVGEGRV